MIGIADAIILAGITGLLGFLWHERSRMAYLEEENDELWDQFSQMVEHIQSVESKVEEVSNGNKAQG
jgi:hypothetical protein